MSPTSCQTAPPRNRGREFYRSGSGYQVEAPFRRAVLSACILRRNSSIAAGYRALRPKELVRDPNGDVIDRIKAERSENAVVSAGLGYEHKLTANTTLTDNLLAESGADIPQPATCWR
jgi:hypothetical protein